MPGGLTFQPAEFAKLALLLFSADVLTRKARLLGDVRHLLVPVLPLTMLLAALVMLEPDLGTTLLLCAIAFGLLFVAGTPLLLLGGIGTLGLSAGMALIMSADYRRTRFLSFMDPAADPQNGGYQFIQGRLALGSGGLLGVGLGAGRQKWSYVPNAHTDFIFAIIGEELGLLGTLSIAAVPRLRLRRGPGRPARPRPVRPLPGWRDHCLDRGPGAGQHRGGGGGAPDHRGAAAAGLLRRVQHAGAAGRHRHAPERGQARGLVGAGPGDRDHHNRRRRAPGPPHRRPCPVPSGQGPPGRRHHHPRRRHRQAPPRRPRPTPNWPAGQGPQRPHPREEPR
jgi:hypothetical protein